MRALAVAAVALLAGCEAVQAPKAAYAPEKAGTVDRALCLLGFTAVPMRTLLSGHHIVDARVNGKPASLIVDTGANATVLDAAAAKALGVGEGVSMPGIAAGVGGTLRARMARAESIDVVGGDGADVRLRQRRVMIADLSGITATLSKVAGRPVHGIVGQDALAEHRAVIDVAGPVLFVQAEDRAPAPSDPAACGPVEGAAAKA